VMEMGVPEPGERSQAGQPVAAVEGRESDPVTVPVGADSVRPPWRFGAAFLIAVTAAEVVTALLEPRWGLALHGLLLLGLPLWSALRWRFPDRKMALAFTLIPLIRVLSLSLPLARFPTVTWYALTAVPLMVSAYAVKQTLGLSRRDVGLTAGRWYVQLLVALPGVAFGLIEYWILRPEPLIGELTLEAAWFPALTLLLATGFAEEFVFRGVLQRISMDVLGRGGLLLVAVIFAVLHVGYLSALDVLFVLIVGLYFAWATLRTGSILGVTLAHGATNILLFLVVPFLGLIAPGPQPAPAQFPMFLTRRTAVATRAVPTLAPPTPTATEYVRPAVTAVLPQEMIQPTPSGPTRPQETPLSFTWGIAAPQPQEPRPFERLFNSPVRFSWRWHRWLEGGEYFEISLWSIDNLLEPVASKVVNDTQCEFDLTPYPPGVYLWGVRVVQGHMEDGQVFVDGPKTLVGTWQSMRWMVYE
jgi:membrane protease YdiL (CAAX protease family)